MCGRPSHPLRFLSITQTRAPRQRTHPATGPYLRVKSSVPCVPFLPSPFQPRRATENSPQFQLWVGRVKAVQVPPGTTETVQVWAPRCSGLIPKPPGHAPSAMLPIIRPIRSIRPNPRTSSHRAAPPDPTRTACLVAALRQNAAFIVPRPPPPPPLNLTRTRPPKRSAGFQPALRVPPHQWRKNTTTTPAHFVRLPSNQPAKPTMARNQPKPSALISVAADVRRLTISPRNAGP